MKNVFEDISAMGGVGTLTAIAGWAFGRGRGRALQGVKLEELINSRLKTLIEGLERRVEAAETAVQRCEEKHEECERKYDDLKREVERRLAEAPSAPPYEPKPQRRRART